LKIRNKTCKELGFVLAVGASCFSNMVFWLNKYRGGISLMGIVEFLEKEQMREDIPQFKTGDTVKVYLRIIEGQKQRIQAYEGVVIRRRQGTSRATFTVRKVSYGVGVEKTFPLHSPVIERIELVTKGRVRRSRLYYLRQLRGKKARIEELKKS
jgi:large subunit ribosomal protein L19